MLLIGITFLLFWLLQVVFVLDEIKAALVTAIIAILIGLVIDHPWSDWPTWKRP